MTLADPAGPERIEQLDDLLAESDYDRMYLDLCRFTVCRFPTRVGLVAGDTPSECGNFDFRQAKDLKEQIDAGHDPLAGCVRIAARHGVEVYVAMRIARPRIS